VVVDRSTFGDTSAANQFSDSAMASGSGSRVGSSRQQQFSLPHTATRTPESTVQPHPAQRTCTNPIISARTVNLPPFGTRPTAGVIQVIRWSWAFLYESTLTGRRRLLR
jgi:hypothetical protein